MTSVVQTLTPAHAIIEVTHSGEITASDLRKSGSEALAIARDQGIWHLLTDCSAVTKVPRLFAAATTSTEPAVDR